VIVPFLSTGPADVTAVTVEATVVMTVRSQKSSKARTGRCLLPDPEHSGGSRYDRDRSPRRAFGPGGRWGVPGLVSLVVVVLLMMWKMSVTIRRKFVHIWFGRLACQNMYARVCFSLRAQVQRLLP